MTTDTDIITALARKLDHENTRLRAQNAPLRAGQGTWPDGDDSPAGEQVPRVISADQVRPEQIIAYWQEGVRPNPFGSVAHVRTVDPEEEGGYRVTDAEGKFDILGGEDDDCTIVLLEESHLADAPTSDNYGATADQWQKAQAMYSHAIMPDGRIINYDQAKHIKDGDPETKPAPRLTVHALNTAPVGSRVSKAKRHWIKTTINGTWFRVTSFGQSEKRTSEDLLAMGLGDATLHHPEATP